MKKKLLSTIIFVIIIFIFSFLITDIVLAADPTIDCERKPDGIHITLRVKFWQNNFTGGDAELKNQVTNNYTPEFVNRFNGFKVAGVPVNFIFDFDVTPGGPGVYPLGGGDPWANVVSNSATCFRNTGNKYNCMNIQNTGILCDGMSSDGCVGSNHPWNYASSSSGPSYGYFNGNFNNPAIGRTRDNNTMAHEIGHLLFLGEEYGNSGWSNNNMMGDSAPNRPTLQKHIDMIVKLACQDENMVCSTGADPRAKCCADRNVRKARLNFAGIDADIEEAGECAKPEMHLCPYEKCPGTSTCNAENKCEGNTCDGTCEATACASLAPAQVPGSGTCSGATPNCCKPKPPVLPPPTGGGGGGPPPPPSGPCEGILCLSCISSGNCTLCDIVSVFYEVAKFIMGIVGAVTLLFVVYGSFMILLSAGIGEKIEQGKRIIINSIIGLVITFSAYLMVTTAVWLATGQYQVFAEALHCEEVRPPSSPTGRPAEAPPSGATEICNLAHKNEVFPSASPSSISKMECVATEAECQPPSSFAGTNATRGICITDPAKKLCCASP